MQAEHNGVQCSASHHCPCSHGLTALSLQPRTPTPAPSSPPTSPTMPVLWAACCLFSISSSMTNPQRANGYAQVYTQVSFTDGLGMGCVLQSAGRHEPVLLKRCTTIMLAAGYGGQKSRWGASQLQRCFPVSSIAADSCSCALPASITGTPAHAPPQAPLPMHQSSMPARIM